MVCREVENGVKTILRVLELSGVTRSSEVSGSVLALTRRVGRVGVLGFENESEVFMSRYQGKEFSAGEAVIPHVFANFLAEENCDYMSPELVGVIVLTVEPIGTMQDLNHALEVFVERAVRDGDEISAEDVAAAGFWVGSFEERYGLTKRFLFE